MDGSSRSTQSGGPRSQSGLACNICLRRMPNIPVAAYCGHVFCWPCLYRSWPQQGPGIQACPAITKSCPVCGTALREGYNIVPIYGFDNVAFPRSGTERPTITGTTTTAAAAAPDTVTSSRPTAAAAAPVSNIPIPPRPTAAAFFTATPRRPDSVMARAAAAAAPDIATSSLPTAAAAAPISNTLIPPRPTAAAFFTATPRHPYSVATRAATAAVPNTATPPRQAAVSSDTDIPPRPNPPSRITQAQTQTQTDTAGAQPAARPLGPNRLGSLRNLASTIPCHGILGELFFSGAGDRLHPASSAARNSGLGVASRSVRRRRNLRLNPRGIDGNGGNSESHRARMEVLHEILDDIRDALAEMDTLLDARDDLEDDLL